MNQSDTARTALVTGAASEGIGVAISRRLAADGYTIIGSYEPDDASRAEELRRDLPEATLVECDHADPSALDQLLESLGDTQICAFVNAQFYFAMEPPGPLDLEQWNRSLAVNLTAPVYLFRRLQGSFTRPASVVTVTSTEAYRGSFGAAAYAASKAAVHNATMTLANLGGENDTRVNAVAAGWIGGVMDTDEVFNMSRSVTPLARLGSPEEIAACVAFLISPESAFVNGSVLVADGGYLGVDSIAKFEFEAEQG